jgi:hypothetical protein
MVRIVIAIIAVTVVFPSTVATAQTKSSGARPPQVSRGQASSKAQSKSQSTTARPSVASLPRVVAKLRPLQRRYKTVDAGAAVIQMKNDVLNQQAPEMSPALVKELDRILEFWSASSEDITRLQGKHFRIVYDTAFEVEKQSEGEFAYEKADKGRLDITPVEVTPQLIAAREQEVVRKPKQKVASRQSVSARTASRLRSSWSSRNAGAAMVSESTAWTWRRKKRSSLNCPPICRAKISWTVRCHSCSGCLRKRPSIASQSSLRTGQFDPKSGRAKLTIYPRLPQDATNWRQADVILDLKEFLPTAVQLLDPAWNKDHGLPVSGLQEEPGGVDWTVDQCQCKDAFHSRPS